MVLHDTIFGKIYADMNAVNNYSYNMTSGDISNFNILYELTTTETTTPTPVPELSWLVIIPLLLSMFSFAVIRRQRKQVKKI
jgi:hypothetical protein